MTNLDGQQVGTTPGAAVNDTPQRTGQGLNTFDLSHYNALTARFADITPFMCLETVPRDSIRFSNNHELRTMTLAAPLLSPVRMHKSYFHVPMKAIMPNSYDMLITNPKRGDDIPERALPKVDFGAFQSRLLNYVHTILSRWNSNNGSTITYADWQAFALLRNVYSKGGLAHMLGLPVYWKHDSTHFPLDFDLAFDKFITTFFDSSNYFADNYISYVLMKSDGISGTTPVCRLNPIRIVEGQTEIVPLALTGHNSVNEFFNLIEQGGVSFVNDTPSGKPLPSELDTIVAEFNSCINEVISYLSTHRTQHSDFYQVNLSKLYGYHMAVAQFFTNDNVDDVDSAELWLKNMRGMFGINTGTSSAGDFFSYNGVLIQLDQTSRAFWDNKITFTTGSTATSVLPYCLNLFCFEQSLKYGDYFNGARTTPLGVGDVNVPVVGNNVSAIDVTKGIAKQRFLNAVNRLSSSLAQYTKGIFGVASGALNPAPQFVARSTSYLGNPETVNTADEQGALTSQLRSNDGKYEFTARFEDFGYLYGFLSFDVIPCYSTIVDRDVYHINRFELFNSMLQNIGDQPIKMSEININSSLSVFGYQQRYAEYKQCVNRCSGQFALNMPEGVYSDIEPYGVANWLYQGATPFVPLDSAFIRHQRTDFDRFYSALDGVSLANYNHFAIVINAQVKANRAMQYQSTIL